MGNLIWAARMGIAVGHIYVDAARHSLAQAPSFLRGGQP